MKIRVSVSKAEQTCKYLRSLIEVQIENYRLVNATIYIAYVRSDTLINLGRPFSEIAMVRQAGESTLGRIT